MLNLSPWDELPGTGRCSISSPYSVVVNGIPSFAFKEALGSPRVLLYAAALATSDRRDRRIPAEPRDGPL